MIRRLKKDVLTELPDKNRQKVIVETDSSIVKSINQLLSNNNIDHMETFFSEFLNNNTAFSIKSPDKR